MLRYPTVGLLHSGRLYATISLQRTSMIGRSEGKSGFLGRIFGGGSSAHEELKQQDTKAAMETEDHKDENDERQLLSIEERLALVAKEAAQLDEGEDWKTLPLTNEALKFRVLLAVEQEFKVDIPNFALADLHTLGDVQSIVEKPPLEKRPMFDKIDFDDLPANLYIQR